MRKSWGNHPRATALLFLSSPASWIQRYQQQMSNSSIMRSTHGSKISPVLSWMLHKLIPLMLLPSEACWCKTSGWIIYLSALRKPMLAPGATTHNWEFSAQTWACWHPLRHLQRMIRAHVMGGSHQMWFELWTLHRETKREVKLWLCGLLHLKGNYFCSATVGQMQITITKCSSSLFQCST